MRTVICYLLASVFARAIISQALGQEPLKPQEVIYELHRSLREALNFPAGGEGKYPYWLSLSTVGSLAADQAAVDMIGDLCPPVSPYFQSFQYGRKLHLRYQDILNFTVSPVVEFSSQYKEAYKVLWADKRVRTPEYEIYRGYEMTNRDLLGKLAAEKDPDKKQALRQTLIDNEKDWGREGYRALIDKAIKTTTGEEYAMDGTRASIRIQKVLDALKDKEGKDILTPQSALSPPPSDWGRPEGWTSFKYSHDIKHTRNEYEERVFDGAGGLSLGFITIAGDGGSKTVTTKNYEKIWKLSYNYEIQKVSIVRNWFEPSVFFEGRSYTWGSKPETAIKFPLIATSPSNLGLPKEPEEYSVLGRDILCPLIPTDLVIARNLSIIATVSKSDYKNVLNEGNVEGGGSLFGIFGGGASSHWKTSTVTQDNDTVTFQIEMPGPAIIGIISQVVPQTPEPDKSLKWPTGSWLP